MRIRSNHSLTPARRVLVAAGGLTTVMFLAACGGSDATQTDTAGAGAAAQSVSVSVHAVPDIGQVLVDSDGMTLYAEDAETAGDIKCTDACLGFWFPLTVKPDETPAGKASLSGKLDTFKRSDNGKTQVTYRGKPLYTFKLDTSAGMAKGDDFTDEFGGTKLDWHAATIAGASTKAPATGGTGGGGYGY